MSPPPPSSLEAGDHDDFRRADDVGEVRIDFGVDVFDVQALHVRPGFLEIGEHVLEQHVNDPLLGRGELAAFDLRVTAVAAEEVVDRGEHQFRIEHDQAGATQRHDLHQVQIGRHMQRVHILAELQHLHRRHRDFRRPAQQVEQADAEQAREPLVDHFERGHAPAHDTNLVREIVVARLAGRDRRFGFDGAAVYTM
jgi:hypothetical protein